MRQIGHLSNQHHANTFGALLFAKDIESTIEQEADGQWYVWVLHDDDLDKASEAFQQFLSDPDNPEFQKLAKTGIHRQKQLEQSTGKSRARQVDVRTTWGRSEYIQMGGITFGLILFSIGLSVVDLFPEGDRIRGFFTFADLARWYSEGNGLKDIASGQVWRLITPILVHFGFIHILFNMMWLQSLGGQVENDKGSLLFGAMVLTFAILPNVGQYLVSGPAFGGMSGVVYGLFGYVWIRMKYTNSPYLLDGGVVLLMLIWFVVCFTGLIGNVANTAHALGLFAGVAWAAVEIRRIPFTSIKF